MRLKEWRESEERVSEAQRWLTKPIGKEILTLLVNEHPGKYVMPLIANVTSEDAIRQLGRIEGYEMALTHLRLVAVRQEEHQGHVESTFEPTQ